MDFHGNVQFVLELDDSGCFANFEILVRKKAAV